MSNSFFDDADVSEWTHDESADSELISTSPSSLEASSNQKGTPVNIILNSPGDLSAAPSTVGFTSFFELAIEELTGSLGVGVCSPEDFASGFRIRGMLYNGGLTNGMVRLLAGFSDLPATGDTVGVCSILERGKNDEQRLKVVYYLNGRCLGTGFNVSVDHLNFRPCIQVDGRAVCRYAAPQTIPSILERQEPTRTNPFVGDYIMTKALRMTAFSGGGFVKFALPKQQEVHVIVRKTVSKGSPEHRALMLEYDLELKVFNTLRTKLSTVPQSSSSLPPDKNIAIEKVEVGHVTSTMMLPPLSLVSVENYIEKTLNGLHQMQVDKENPDKLVMKCHAAEWSCQRHVQSFEPVTSYKE